MLNASLYIYVILLKTPESNGTVQMNKQPLFLNQSTRLKSPQSGCRKTFLFKMHIVFHVVLHVVLHIIFIMRQRFCTQTTKVNPKKYLLLFVMPIVYNVAALVTCCFDCFDCFNCV